MHAGPVPELEVGMDVKGGPTLTVRAQHSCDGRLALPTGAGPVESLALGAVGYQWIELTSDLRRSALLAPFPIDARGRFRLRGRGVQLRFGRPPFGPRKSTDLADEGIDVLVIAAQCPEVTQVLVLGSYDTISGIVARRPDQLLTAPGWRSVWEEVADRGRPSGPGSEGADRDTDISGSRFAPNRG